MFHLIATLSLSAFAQEAPPIVNGSTTTDYEAVGVLVSTNNQGAGYDFCSATLVDENWVITAAHCIEGMEDNERYGYSNHYFMVGTDLYANGKITASAKIKKAYPHPNYNTNTLAHDIGVMELYAGMEGVETMYVNKGGLGLSFKNKDVVYVGWGVTSDTAYNSSGVKRTVTVPVCTTGYCPAAGYSNDHLYTYDSTGGNICSGDSGGAALIEDDGFMLLAGANSFGFSNSGGYPDCTGRNAAAAATRVDTNLDWIEGYIQLPDPAEDTGNDGNNGNNTGDGNGNNNTGDDNTDDENTGSLGDAGGTSGDEQVDWREALGCSAAPLSGAGAGLLWLAGLVSLRRRG